MLKLGDSTEERCECLSPLGVRLVPDVILHLANKLLECLNEYLNSSITFHAQPGYNRVQTGTITSCGDENLSAMQFWSHSENKFSSIVLDSLKA